MKIRMFCVVLVLTLAFGCSAPKPVEQQSACEMPADVLKSVENGIDKASEGYRWLKRTVDTHALVSQASKDCEAQLERCKTLGDTQSKKFIEATNCVGGSREAKKAFASIYGHMIADMKLSPAQLAEAGLPAFLPEE